MSIDRMTKEIADEALDIARKTLTWLETITNNPNNKHAQITGKVLNAQVNKALIKCHDLLLIIKFEDAFKYYSVCRSLTQALLLSQREINAVLYQLALQEEPMKLANTIEEAKRVLEFGEKLQQQR